MFSFPSFMSTTPSPPSTGRFAEQPLSFTSPTGNVSLLLRTSALQTAATLLTDTFSMIPLLDFAVYRSFRSRMLQLQIGAMVLERWLDNYSCSSMLIHAIDIVQSEDTYMNLYYQAQLWLYTKSMLDGESEPLSDVAIGELCSSLENIKSVGYQLGVRIESEVSRLAVAAATLSNPPGTTSASGPGTTTVAWSSIPEIMQYLTLLP